MLNYLRGSNTSLPPGEVTQSVYVKEAQKYNGGRAYSFAQEYQLQRQQKQYYIQEILVANGYDIEGFYALLNKEKGMSSNNSKSSKITIINRIWTQY